MWCRGESVLGCLHVSFLVGHTRPPPPTYPPTSPPPHTHTSCTGILFTDLVGVGGNWWETGANVQSSFDLKTLVAVEVALFAVLESFRVKAYETTGEVRACRGGGGGGGAAEVQRRTISADDRWSSAVGPRIAGCRPAPAPSHPPSNAHQPRRAAPPPRLPACPPACLPPVLPSFASVLQGDGRPGICSLGNPIWWCLQGWRPIPW